MIYGAMLRTPDGVRIDAAHLPGDGDLGIVVAHGFTGTWRSPANLRIAAAFARRAGVIAFDFRGHGRSSGVSTVGDLEILDLDAAVRHARAHYAKVATVGFSMGAAVAVRHAALHRGVDAVVSVSGPARWYYRGTRPMRTVHWAIERPLGRLVARVGRRTRIKVGSWDPVPLAPFEAAPLISPQPLLVVHGDADAFFPLEHAEQLHACANEPKELWVEPGFGHAEAAASPDLIRRIEDWIFVRTKSARASST